MKRLDECSVVEAEIIGAWRIGPATICVHVRRGFLWWKRVEPYHVHMDGSGAYWESTHIPIRFATETFWDTVHNAARGPATLPPSLSG